MTLLRSSSISHPPPVQRSEPKPPYEDSDPLGASAETRQALPLTVLYEEKEDTASGVVINARHLTKRDEYIQTVYSIVTNFSKDTIFILNMYKYKPH